MTRSAVLRTLLLLLFCLMVPQCVWAQTPTTLPDNGRSPLVVFRFLTDEEKSQVLVWTNSYLPNLAKLIKTASDSRAPFKANRLRNAAAARFRTYQQVKDNKAVLEALMKDVRLENEIFGYIGDLDSASPDKREALMQQIRDKTRLMVNQFLDDREDRIAKLRTKLDAEQKSLDYDRSHADALVDQRLRHFYIDPPTSAPTTDASSSDASQ